MQKALKQAKILVIDDDPDNIRLIHQVLKAEGYQVSALTQPALLESVLAQTQPDLILLDVSMPPFSGFEMCRQLKQDARWTNVPVIFLTGMTEDTAVKEGFAAGGVDYITKPFSVIELTARVKNHLVIRFQHQHLTALNQEKNKILMIASHDLRSPFASIQMATQLLTSSRTLSDAQKIQIFSTIERATQRGLELIQNLLDVHRIEAGYSEPEWDQIEVTYLLQQVYVLYQQVAQRKDIHLQLQGDAVEPVRSDAKLLLQVLDNLVSNAIKYTPVGGRVHMRLKSQENHRPWIQIQDQGPGFTAEDKARLYQRFAQLSARPTANENSHGLGLAIVKELCDKLNIDIQLETSSEGSCFNLIF